MTAPAELKWVYDFSQAPSDLRHLLGKTGTRLAELVDTLGPPYVPAGFTVTAEACTAVDGGGQSQSGLEDQVKAAIGRIEQRTDSILDDPDRPLLVSVRPSNRDSVPDALAPGLFLGTSDDCVAGLARQCGDEQLAWDFFRRSLQGFGNAVYGIPLEQYAKLLEDVRERAGLKRDSRLGPDELREVTHLFQELFTTCTGQPLPRPRDQVGQAIRAILASRANDRHNKAPDESGVAVNVQQIVWPRDGLPSVRGVAFSRDEMTGESQPSGYFRAYGNENGDDVEANHDLYALDQLAPGSHDRLAWALKELEGRFRDMQEAEFVMVDDQLYVLEARNAERSPQAMVRFACDAVDEGLMTEEEALASIDAGSLDGLLHPTFDPREQVQVLACGVAASPGAAKGEVVFTVDEVSAAAAQGREVIFARRFADAGDVAGFAEAKGILTSEGGMTSHAAMVARGMGRPAVVGAGELDIDPRQRTIRCGDTVIATGERIAIDGGTGVVTLDDVPLVAARGSSHLRRVLEWADSIRTLQVRVNADVPRDAEQGIELGAEGIGVCRTEHMFMRADRQPMMRAMIMARTPAEREAVLAELLPAQQSDFEGLFEAMGDLPVTIRLLDPPLHEFLPDQVALVQRVQVAREHDSAEREALERELDVVLDLAEVNPMLGTRGCRLGVVHPEIYEMQVEAIMRAASAVGKRVGQRPQPEVMIPLVAYEQELAILRALVDTVAAGHGMQEGVDYTVGTMIELPRACFAADRLAVHAEFFSFGTNDLTQTALGFSRDDVEADFVATYLEQDVFDRSPFQTIDTSSVGELVKLAVERGREHRPEISLGVCGEHGGDPDSIGFFHRIGVDYVSCSLYRLPVARVAAAQAQIADPDQGLQ